MSKRKVVLHSVGVLAVGLIAFWASTRLAVNRSVLAEVRTTPYIIELWTYQFGYPSPGERTVIGKQVTAMRSDGTLAMTMSNEKAGPIALTRTIEYTNGLVSVMVDHFRVKSTTHRLREDVAARLHRT